MRQKQNSKRYFSFLLLIYTSYRFSILNSFLNHHSRSTLNASFFMQGGGISIIKSCQFSENDHAVGSSIESWKMQSKRSQN
ncbi:hypothetical protein YC2023_011327 [Brassica napus]